RRQRLALRLLLRRRGDHRERSRLVLLVLEDGGDRDVDRLGLEDVLAALQPLERHREAVHPLLGLVEELRVRNLHLVHRVDARLEDVRELAQAHEAGHARAAFERMQVALQLPRHRMVQRRTPSLTSGMISFASSMKTGSRSRSTSSWILRCSLPASNWRAGSRGSGFAAACAANAAAAAAGISILGAGVAATGCTGASTTGGGAASKTGGAGASAAACGGAPSSIGSAVGGASPLRASSASRTTPGMRRCVPSPVLRAWRRPSRNAARSPTTSSRGYGSADPRTDSTIARSASTARRVTTSRFTSNSGGS